MFQCIYFFEKTNVVKYKFWAVRFSSNKLITLDNICFEKKKLEKIKNVGRDQIIELSKISREKSFFLNSQLLYSFLKSSRKWKCRMNVCFL